MKKRIHIFSQGFTLIELVVVMAIIGILLSGAFFVYIRIIERSRINQAVSDVQKIARAVEEYHTDMGFYPPDTTSSDPGFIRYRSVGCNSTTCPRGYNPSTPATPPPSAYNGPYLDIPSWPIETPWGGAYDYDYWTDSVANAARGTAWGGCNGMQGGIYITIRAATLPAQTEQYFQRQGHDNDSCAAPNGRIFYMVKPL